MSSSSSSSTVSLQQQVDAREAPEVRRFGTFSGVFVPTLLTILGVIMYLREGWVVGNAGLLGAWAIILLAGGIVAFTGLSLSSITTNIRIGAGGAFSIITQALGLEAGGSIGLSFYLAQALAVAMYIFGFREGWLRIFPTHPPLIVDLVTFAVLFIIAWVSANLAFRVQYLILAIVALSLVSAFAVFITGPLPYQPTWIGNFPGTPENGFQGVSFWYVFAVFFPAMTGIMAGANMSGELKDPRRSIPLGTMSAIVLSLVIYLSLAYWFARVASPDDLVRNYTVMIEKSLWPPAVLAGLLGATFSSGLSSLVGAPRILQALAAHNVIPKGDALARLGSNGEPRAALVFTGIIVLAALLLRNLNAIAPLITMFFLITYAIINVVLLLEERLKLTSFRPLLRVPVIVPLLGAVGSLAVMFIINPVFSLVAVVVVLLIYWGLQRRRLRAPYGDLRSGLFVALAEWAAMHVSELPSDQERAWRPNLLAPFQDPAEIWSVFEFLHDLIYPQGSIKLLGLTRDHEDARMGKNVAELRQAFRAKGIYAVSAMVVDPDPVEGLLASIQALSGVVFRPNVLWLHANVFAEEAFRSRLQEIADEAHRVGMGVMMLGSGPKAGFGERQRITVWVHDQSPAWELDMHLGNIDLALLSAYLLRQNWQGRIEVVTVVANAEEVDKARRYLNHLVDMARLRHVDVRVEQGAFLDALAASGHSDLHIVGFPKRLSMDFVDTVMAHAGAACLFVQDSGRENVLA